MPQCATQQFLSIGNFGFYFDFITRSSVDGFAEVGGGKFRVFLEVFDEVGGIVETEAVGDLVDV